MRKILLSLCIIALAMSFPVLASAQTLPKPTIEHSLRWSYLADIKSSLSISSMGTASVTASASSLSADGIEIEAILQRGDGGSWDETYSWSKYASGQKVGVGGNYMVDKGYSYRIVTTAWVYVNGELVESASTTYNYGYFG